MSPLPKIHPSCSAVARPTPPMEPVRAHQEIAALDLIARALPSLFDINSIGWSGKFACHEVSGLDYRH